MTFGLGLIDIGLMASKIHSLHDINLLALLEMSGNFIWLEIWSFCDCYKLSSLNLRSQELQYSYISVHHQHRPPAEQEITNCKVS